MKYKWEKYSDDRLLNLRFCDLRLKLVDTPIQKRVDKLYEELERKGLDFKPHFWLSNDWFTPEGIAGIAVPFYVAHPRLRRLEKKQVYEVEGGEARWFMKLLRHECGHADPFLDIGAEQGDLLCCWQTPLDLERPDHAVTDSLCALGSGRP